MASESGQYACRGFRALLQPHPTSSALAREWLATHKQRLAWVLVAIAMATVAATATAGGFLLHRAAEIERQALRTQRLGSAAFQLQDIVSRAEAAGVTASLTAEQTRALTEADAAYRRIRTHDRAEGGRLQPSYTSFLRSSVRAYALAGTGRERLPSREQRVLEGRLSELESRIDGEAQRLAHASSVANPRARTALLVALGAAIALVALLIWQFESQRRAGRIDRDNARRSEELVRLRDEFIASVSHELRTPLTSILGYLDLIREKEANVEPTEDGVFLEVVARNADRLLRLVSDLLLVAEMEGGRLALQTGTVDLGVLAGECVDARRPDADNRRISLVLAREPAPLEGDGIRLAQMMDNVVSNAIKFTPPGGRVSVQAGTRDGDPLFEVADSGPGISAADQEHLFDPFFRTQSAQLQGIKGTGLGLAITKAIVEAHGGSIALESNPEAGTTFRITFPRHRSGGVTPEQDVEGGRAEAQSSPLARPVS